MNDKICYINLNNTILNKSFEVVVDDEVFITAKGDITKGNVIAKVICDKIVDDSFHFNIHSVGHVFTPCDICLEDVELRIDIQDELVVTLGEEELDDGEVVTIERDKPFLNLTDIVYQIVTVSLPIKRVHEPGMCNNVMMNEFNKHQVARSNDEQTDINDQNPSFNHDKHDPRWDELKKIFNK